MPLTLYVLPHILSLEMLLLLSSRLVLGGALSAPGVGEMKPRVGNEQWQTLGECGQWRMFDVSLMSSISFLFPFDYTHGDGKQEQDKG